MKNFVAGVLGAGFGERVVIPCINYVDGIRLKYFYCRNKIKVKNKKNLKFYVIFQLRSLNDFLWCSVIPYFSIAFL